MLVPSSSSTTEAHRSLSPPPPAAGHSSFFLQEAPPAPQATKYDVIEEHQPISQSSLQPHIENRAIATPTKYDNKNCLTAPPPLYHISSLLKPPETNFIPEKSPLLFSSVPLDALHSIAGFLTAEEWCNVGLVNKEALVACREVFKKVKMHSFKCAVEIMSAWVSFH